jgi:hypothetical protein
VSEYSITKGDKEIDQWDGPVLILSSDYNAWDFHVNENLRGMTPVLVWRGWRDRENCANRSFNSDRRLFRDEKNALCRADRNPPCAFHFFILWRPLGRRRLSHGGKPPQLFALVLLKPFAPE